ncbi:MAG: hypothetical protein H0T49_05030 [Chloroflexia bacterium]|nr:hypothetical protein [Chloroflexia bacterium]
MSEPDSSPPIALDLARVPDLAVWSEIIPGIIAGASTWLACQRWFGDKARQLTAIVPIFYDTRIVGEDVYALLIAETRFFSGEPERYFIPLAATHHPTDYPGHLVEVSAPDGLWRVVDAFSLPYFRDWLLELFGMASQISGHGGTFSWRPTSIIADHFLAARSAGSRVSTAEQSNTSVVYGDALILKVFRKQQKGLNPDLEVGHFLAGRTAYRNVPLLVGEFQFALEHEPRAIQSLGMMQTYVPSSGDGWSYTLRELETWSTEHEQSEAFVRALNLLGRRTGELHLALASDSTDHDFAPENVTQYAIDGWSQSLVLTLDATVTALRDRLRTLSAETQDLTSRFIGVRNQLAALTRGFATLNLSVRTRVHGDYHLGQVLRTLTDDWMILDFEGEPARPIEARREKTSPLKDVAGMIRSFDYARAASLASHAGEPQVATDATLANWEKRARNAFIKGYRDAISTSPIRIAPLERAAFTSALRAWELDKALYEIHYELNNRPHLVNIPLSAALRIASAS